MKNIRILLFSILILHFVPISIYSQKIKAKVPKGFVYIPAGNFLYNDDTVSVKSFWMYKTELSNLDYKEFLMDLERNGKAEQLKIATIDTLKWRDSLAYNEPYVAYYHRHSAYQHYPLVNISYEAAQLYCNWLSEKITKLNKGKYVVTARLPSQVEWVYAASNGGTTSPYSWQGVYPRNKNGCMMANFVYMKPSDSDSTHQKQNADITAPVKSYFPSSFGLHNMNGNVAEMVQENSIAMGGSWKSKGFEIKNTAHTTYSEPTITIGFRPVLTILKP